MTPHRPFPLLSRILHWTMAAMILAMLFIGIGMVGSVSEYHRLVSIHKPLGILVLILVAIRLVNRLLNPPPPLPSGMPGWQRLAAHGSHVVLYALMFAVPLVGWAMLSAARYPIVLYGPLQLPPIVPQSPTLFAVLRETHTVLALLLFAIFLAHLSAALMHALIFRDDVFPSMTSFRFAGDQEADVSGNDPRGGAEASAARRWQRESKYKKAAGSSGYCVQNPWYLQYGPDGRKPDTTGRGDRPRRQQPDRSGAAQLPVTTAPATTISRRVD